MATISVCMIVKNEEKLLERCLNSLQGIWDELIIVDTGSTDSTKEIAGRFTDKIYDFSWIHDFAAARNFAFSKATCEYVYSADADEVLDEANRKRFFDLKQALIPEVEVVQMWYVTPEEFNTTENFDKEYRPKLYKRLRELTWIEPIHEMIRLEPVVFDSDIEILHKPHDNHAGRDFRIFEKMISERKYISARLHKMYARELMLSGTEEDFVKAESFFLESMQEETRGQQEYQEALCVLTKCYRLTENEVAFLEMALNAVATMPCSEVCLELGIYFYDKKDYPNAVRWFQSAIQETEAVIDAASHDRKPEEYLQKCKK